MTVFMFIIFIGLIVAWKKEGIGGLTALIGLIGFDFLAPATVPGWQLRNATVLYGLPTLLFVFCWWQTRKQINPKGT